MIALIFLVFPLKGKAINIRYVEQNQKIQEVINQASKGDTIILKDGIYHENITINQSITLKAEHPGEATITNKYFKDVDWEKSSEDNVWVAKNIDWPVHRMLVEGVHAFDYRSKANFDLRECGPNWSKGWQEKKYYGIPPIYFARDSTTNSLWLRLLDGQDPNYLQLDFNSGHLGGKTLVQKDLGAYWNQQQIVTISNPPPVHPIIHWYGGDEQNPKKPKVINFPPVCGININIKSDDVTIEGLRVHMAPTVGIEVNNSKNVTITECYFSGYQFAINSGYECTNLTVTHCEMDGGRMVSFGGHRNVNDNMWNHSTYVNPIKFNGTGLKFHHNYIYEGYDLFHPRGRHKDYSDVPDLRSDVGFNIWQNAIDNVAEFDGVEALMNLRFHHNLVLSDHDALAITTTENGGPLTIDHNIWWPGGGRIMKLVGTSRTNRGVQFVHNTYFTGDRGSSNEFEQSAFENNIVISKCEEITWTPESLGEFFPTKHNLLLSGDQYTTGFDGITSDPHFGTSPSTIFLLQEGSPAIDAGVKNDRYFQSNVLDDQPDLGAIEYGQDMDAWAEMFGHCGPTWISLDNQRIKAPNRPEWPKEINRRWGGI